MRFSVAASIISALSFSSLVAAAPNTGSSQLKPVSDPRKCGTVEIWDEAVEKTMSVSKWRNLANAYADTLNSPVRPSSPTSRPPGSRREDSSREPRNK